MDIFHHLLSNSTEFNLNQWSAEAVEKKMTLKLSSKQIVVDCPECQHPTKQVYSYYERTLGDLSWADYSIYLKLRARKFFCRN